MENWWMIASEEIHVLLAFVATLVVIPAWILRRVHPLDARWKLTMWMSLGLSFSSLTVVGLAALGAVRFSVFIALIVFAIFLGGLLGPSSTAKDAKRASTIHILNILDQPSKALADLMQFLKERTREAWQGLMKDYGWTGTAMAVAAIGITLIRYSIPVWLQAAPGTPLGYFNVLHIAMLTNNLGLYRGGVGPEGLFGLGAGMSTLFLTPPMELLQFFYPMTATVSVLAMGIIVFHATHSHRLTAFSMLVMAASGIAFFQAPVNLASPLAVHWAVIALLLGLSHLIAYVRQPERTDRARMFALTLATSTVFNIDLGLFEAALGLIAALLIVIQTGSTTTLIREVRWWIVAVLVGSLPLWAGRWLGRGLGLSSWIHPVFAAEPPLWHLPFSPTHLFFWVASALVARSVTQAKEPATRLLALATAACLAPLIDPAWFDGLGNVMVGSGLPGFLVLALLLATLAAPYARQASLKRPLNIGLSLAALASLLVPARVYVPHRFEPRGSGRTTESILSRYPAFQWTIVSPVEEYSEVLGRGWQQEITYFVAHHSLAQAKNPHFFLKSAQHSPILTPNVFLYADPRGFPVGIALTLRDARRPLGRTPSFRQIEARAYYWALAYHKSHPHSSRIYFKNSQFLALWIRQ